MKLSSRFFCLLIYIFFSFFFYNKKYKNKREEASLAMLVCVLPFRMVFVKKFQVSNGSGYGFSYALLLVKRISPLFP